MEETANRNNIWQSPIYLPYVNDPLTEDAIKKTEKAIGQKLPDAYLNLLSVQNGGGIRWTLKDTCHGEISGIGDRYPHLDVLSWNEYEIKEWRSFGNSLIPFDGDGHWLLCFDYRKQKLNPQITFVDSETSEPTVKILFNDFAEYLAHLQRPDPFGSPVIGVRDPLSSYDLVFEVAKRCRLKFADVPEYFNHGFSRYDAREKRGETWHTLSGHPNLVPRTFVRVKEYREDPLRFDRLQRLFPGSCYLYPRHPDVLQILSTSDAAMPAVNEAVIAMGLNHVVLNPSERDPR